MFNSGEADGWDGYYYVMQLDSWQHLGHLHAANYSLIYVPLLLIGSFTTALLSYQLTVWIISCLLFVAVVQLFGKVRARIQVALVLLVLALSPHLLFFSLQFPKMLLGLSFLIFGLRMLKEGKWSWLIVFFVLTFLSHRAVFGFALLFIPLFIRLERKVLIIFAAGVFFALVLIALNIPGLPRFSDFSRINGHFSTSLYWGVFDFYSLWGLFDSKVWLFEFVLIHGFLVVIISVMIRKFTNRRYLLMLPVMLLLLPLFNYEAGSIGYRLQLLGVVAVVITGVIVVNKYKYVLLGCGLFLLITNATSAYFPGKFNPPFNQYRRIASQLESELSETKVDLIIAHKGLKEQVLLESNLPALNWSPDTITTNTFRVVTGVPVFVLNQNLSLNEITAVKDLGYNYFLIPEFLFREKLQEYVFESQIKHPEMEWLNPLKVRPDYLR